ncbi:DUF3857 and transglutaminase domain-containing protein [candidate division KSB1 bacterium]|nr:DUF3857 and transglutaminase domain-containing protein [candidate division KSB1 bacterium]
MQKNISNLSKCKKYGEKGRTRHTYSAKIKAGSYLLAFLTAAFIFFSLSCAGSYYQSPPPDLGKMFRDAELVEEKFPDENAVLLLDDGELEIFKSNEIAYSSFKRHRIIKISNKYGVYQANVTIPYSGSTIVRTVQARTIKPDGTILILDPKDVFDITLYPGFIFYADIRAKRFTLPGVEPGCIIEYGFEKNMRHFTYWDSWQFQNEIPTLLSRYKVRAPAEWEIKWRTQEIDIAPQTLELPDGFKQDYVWEAGDMPPLVPESAMPPFKKVAASVIFSPVGVKNWADVANWYNELFFDRVKADKSIREKTAELFAACGSDREKLLKIYNFVRDYIRYVAISIGIGGYQPHFAGEVLRNRYGDCKDKICLMTAMASEAGIQIDPVLVSTWQNGTVDTTLASHIFFNHVIGRAQLSDGRIVWLDPTSEFSNFNELPWYDRNRRVLHIQKNGRYAWHRTPASRPEYNLISRNWTFEMESGDTLIVDLDVQLTGAQALNARQAITGLRRIERKTWLQETFLSGFASVRMDTFFIKNEEQYQLPLQFQITFLIPTTPGLVFRIRDYCGRGLYDLFSAQSRQYDVELPYGYQTIDTITFIYPQDKTIRMESPGVNPKTPFGSCKLDVRSNTGELQLQRVFTLRKNDISREEYTDFKDFCDAVAVLDHSAFWLADGN